MICEQWLRWITIERLKEHSMACGYKFKMEKFEANDSQSKVVISNTGVAPIYYDAYVTVNGTRADESLMYLQPGESKTFTVKSGGAKPKLTIECDRLVDGQVIEYEADL